MSNSNSYSTAAQSATPLSSPVSSPRNNDSNSFSIGSMGNGADGYEGFYFYTLKSLKTEISEIVTKGVPKSIISSPNALSRSGSGVSTKSASTTLSEKEEDKQAAIGELFKTKPIVLLAAVEGIDSTKVVKDFAELKDKSILAINFGFYEYLVTQDISKIPTEVKSKLFLGTDMKKTNPVAGFFVPFIHSLNFLIQHKRDAEHPLKGFDDLYNFVKTEFAKETGASPFGLKPQQAGVIETDFPTTELFPKELNLFEILDLLQAGPCPLYQYLNFAFTGPKGKPKTLSEWLKTQSELETGIGGGKPFPTDLMIKYGGAIDSTRLKKLAADFDAAHRPLASAASLFAEQVAPLEKMLAEAETMLKNAQGKVKEGMALRPDANVHEQTRVAMTKAENEKIFAEMEVIVGGMRKKMEALKPKVKPVAVGGSGGAQGGAPVSGTGRPAVVPTGGAPVSGAEKPGDGSTGGIGETTGGVDKPPAGGPTGGVGGNGAGKTVGSTGGSQKIDLSSLDKINEWVQKTFNELKPVTSLNFQKNASTKSSNSDDTLAKFPTFSKEKGYEIVDTPGHGNCLISAFLSAVSPAYRSIKQIGQSVGDNIQDQISVRYRNAMKDFLNTNGQPIFTQEQLANICKPNEFLMDSVGQSLANYYNLNIIYLVSYNTEVQQPNKIISIVEDRPNTIIIHLSGGTLKADSGAHYSVVRKGLNYLIPTQSNDEIKNLILSVEDPHDRLLRFTEKYSDFMDLFPEDANSPSPNTITTASALIEQMEVDQKLIVANPKRAQYQLDAVNAMMETVQNTLKEKGGEQGVEQGEGGESNEENENGEGGEGGDANAAASGASAAATIGAGNQPAGPQIGAAPSGGAGGGGEGGANAAGTSGNYNINTLEGFKKANDADAKNAKSVFDSIKDESSINDIDNAIESIRQSERFILGRISNPLRLSALAIKGKGDLGTEQRTVQQILQRLQGYIKTLEDKRNQILANEIAQREKRAAEAAAAAAAKRAEEEAAAQRQRNAEAVAAAAKKAREEAAAAEEKRKQNAAAAAAKKKAEEEAAAAAAAKKMAEEQAAAAAAASATGGGAQPAGGAASTGEAEVTVQPQVQPAAPSERPNAARPTNGSNTSNTTPKSTTNSSVVEKKTQSNLRQTTTNALNIEIQNISSQLNQARKNLTERKRQRSSNFTRSGSSKSGWLQELQQRQTTIQKLERQLQEKEKKKVNAETRAREIAAGKTLRRRRNRKARKTRRNK